jgi:hypothetical protein
MSVTSQALLYTEIGVYMNQARPFAILCRPFASKFRLFAALLAVFAILLVTTVSVLPGHGHENDSARSCDICNSGHLPCLQAPGQVQFTVQMPVIWQHVSETSERRSDCATVIRSPRAPPV